MNSRRNGILLSLLIALIAAVLGLRARGQEKSAETQWPVAAPEAVGLDFAALKGLDADIAAAKYGLEDSLLVVRDGKQVFARTYAHDYGKLYGELAKKEGPLNHDVKGPYNYYSAEFHPYYQHGDLHTMQSVSKSVTSITIGIAIGRKEFPADLDAPILKYFDEYKIANVDERKRRITLRNLLTMTAGIEWHEDTAYNDPTNSCDIMESKRDWVEYVINQPMAAEPGKVWVYSSGVTELLAHIFKKATGKNVDEYAAQYLFAPLGIAYHWKHAPTGLPDTEGGLYISTASLAKIGYLFLEDGKWNGKQIVPAEWVKASVQPAMKISDEGREWRYGFQWWLDPYSKSPEKFAWAARGFGGQELRVAPEYRLIVVTTGWDILPSKEELRYDQLQRVIAAIKSRRP